MDHSYQYSSKTNSDNRSYVKTVGTGTLDSQHIKPRQFNVEYEEATEINKHWVQNDAFLSHWMNAYTLIIPDGEFFNTRIIRERIDEIQSDELKQRVKGLVAQELSHGMAHSKFLKLLESQGYNTSVFFAVYRFISFKILEPLSTDNTKLAFIVAVERINELISEITLKSKVLDDAPASAAILYKWHFAEEIEHKSVVFDLYHTLSGNRLLLAYSTMLCYLVNIGFLFLALIMLSIQDLSLFKKTFWLRGFRYFLTKEKFLWKVSVGCAQLLKKGFHPSQTDNLQLAQHILNGPVIQVAEEGLTPSTVE